MIRRFTFLRSPPWLLLAGLIMVPGLRAQELEPGAYSPSPVGFNLVVLADTYSYGDMTFDPSLPVEDATARINASAFAYVRTLGLAGRSANVSFALPYARGHLEGIYLGEPQALSRSGVADPRVRLAVNLLGAPAMTPKEFAAHRPKTVLGASLVVSLPLGQYDPAKLINIGNHRWGFKPEVGLAHTLGSWTLEADAGVWLYTDNTNFAGGKTRTQDPLFSYQWHVIYTFKPRMWLALDANYFNGGQTAINGVAKADEQRNSRVGLTYALPVTAQHSLKFSWNRGAFTNIGGDFNSFGVAWQYVWR